MVKFIFMFLGMLYLGLMIAAYQHVKEGESVIAIGPWWCLYKKSYEDGARKICDLGRVVLVIDILLIAYIFV